MVVKTFIRALRADIHDQKYVYITCCVALDLEAKYYLYVFANQEMEDVYTNMPSSFMFLG